MLRFLLLPACSLLFLPLCATRGAEDLVLADFEGPTYGEWKAEGTAFGPGPSAALPGQMPVDGFEGKSFANSFHGHDKPTGRLVSPPFTVNRRFVKFLIGGGGWADKTCMNLVVGEKVVRTATGPNTKPGGHETLAPGVWEVKEFLGREARIEIVDEESGGWGHINVDQIVLTDTPPPRVLQNFQREVRLEHPLLNLPVRTGSPRRHLKIMVEGQTVRELDLELAEGKPDFWVFTDVTPWLGKVATLEVNRLPENSEGLRLVETGETITGGEDLYAEALRPQVHFTTKRGWINDPNGMAWYNGEYHMFYQHSPFTWGGAQKYWGHAVSKDMLHWEELPTALEPDALGQMYSGGGLVDTANTSGFGRDGKAPLVLVYTAAGSWGQCLAYTTDGRTITKYEKNPVLAQVTPGNRDPHVFWHEPTKKWVMALYVGYPIPGQTDAQGKPAHRDTIHFFGSKDLKKWDSLSEIEGYYECPDMFQLPLDGDTGKMKWVLTAASSDYQVGSFDGTTFTPETPKIKGHQGNGFYAAQTFAHEPKGRVVQVGWGTIAAPGMPFNQQLDFPCELTLHTTPEGPRMYWQPVAELKGLWDSELTRENHPVTPETKPDWCRGPGQLDARVELVPGSAAEIGVVIRNGVEVVYNVAKGELSCMGKTARLPLIDGAVKLRLIVDRLSIEIFGADGLVYMPISDRPKTQELTFGPFARGGSGTVRSLELHTLKSVWPPAPGKAPAAAVKEETKQVTLRSVPAGRDFGVTAELQDSLANLAANSEMPLPDAPAWKTEGEAWQWVDVREKVAPEGLVGTGCFISGRRGPGAVGTVISPEFTIERPYLNFQVLGARNRPARLGAELLVEGRVVRAAAASDEMTRTAQWRTWDVRDLAGKRATVRYTDAAERGWLDASVPVQSNSARVLPTDAAIPLHETWRPRFHYTAEAGWLNDANGLFYFEGAWHLCHQYRPPGAPTLSWGHATSSDLLHWKHQAPAIEGEAEASIFSGSAAIDWRNASGLQQGEKPPILLCYTEQPIAQTGRKSVQCLSVSTDGGATFHKYVGNPVLRTPDAADRDPHLLWHEPSRAFFQVLSLSRNNTDREHATYGIFRSPDAKQWELQQEVGPGGWYWECPDFFELPVVERPGETRWLLMKGSGDYVLGKFDGKQFVPEGEPTRGAFGSFYGAQTFCDAPGGRRVQIGWMNSGPKDTLARAYPGMPFNQQMGFPRELTLHATPAGLQLHREPVKEIRQLYTREQELGGRTLAPGENALAGVTGETLDVESEVELQKATAVKLVLRKQEVRYDVKTAKLIAFGRSVPLEAPGGRLKLRALLDVASLELFANDGEVTHAGVFFAPAGEAKLEVEGGAARLERLAVREVAGVWR